MRRKEMQKLLDERAERIDLLDQRLAAMEQLVDSYKKREQSVVDAMSNMRESADRYKQETEEKARELIAAAQERARTALSDAQLRARTMVEEAEEKASEVLKSARERSSRMLSQAEASVSEYETLLAAYNETLEKNAAEAAESAERYSQYMRARKLPKTGLGEEVSGISKIPYAPDVRLPNPENDPVQLMQNIYKLQNRDIPQQKRTAQPREGTVPPWSSAPQPPVQDPKNAHAAAGEQASQDAHDSVHAAAQQSSAAFWANFTSHTERPAAPEQKREQEAPPAEEPVVKEAEAREAAPAAEAGFVFYAPPAQAPATPKPEPHDSADREEAEIVPSSPEQEPVAGPDDAKTANEQIPAFDWQAVKQRYEQPAPDASPKQDEGIPDFDWDVALRDLGDAPSAPPQSQEATAQETPQPFSQPPVPPQPAGPRYASQSPAPEMGTQEPSRHVPRHAAPVMAPGQQAAPQPQNFAAYAEPEAQASDEQPIPWDEIMPDLDAPMPEREKLWQDAEEAVPTVTQFVGTDAREEEISLDALLDEIIRAGEKNKQ